MCCKSLAIEIPLFVARWPWAVKLIHGWYRSIFNFHYLGTLKENWLVYECHYLRKDNTCGIYPYRPKLCREFPLTPLFGHGGLHKGCGFWFAKRSELGTFREKLTEQAHAQERVEYLSHLDREAASVKP
jgi:Fe-S-cluster containining protein